MKHNMRRYIKKLIIVVILIFIFYIEWKLDNETNYQERPKYMDLKETK